MLLMLSGWIAFAVAGATPAETVPTDQSLTELAQIRFPEETMITSIGQELDLSTSKGNKGTVLVFLSTECPLSNGYIPTISRLAKEYQKNGIEFIGLNPNAGQALKDIELHRIRYSIKMTVVRDPSARVAQALGITKCPEVIVFDGAGKAVYRGRIDDRYPRRGGAQKQVFHVHDLEDVLKSLVAGKAVQPHEAEAIGCPVVVTSPADLPPTANATVTFTRDVAAILQRNCQECHREGGIGPFSLVQYDEAVLWADDIVTFTEDRTMPPWKLVEGHGDFDNVRRMNDADIQTLKTWVQEGCVRGDLAEQPEPPTFPEGWRLGTPDKVLGMQESYSLEAEGPDEYRHFVIPTNFGKDVYISAIELMPGNLRVDHHIIVFLDPTGISEKLDAADPSPGYLTSGGSPGYIAPGMLGGWAPGNAASPLPEGVARIIPKDARIVLQMHYHKSGKAETDQTKVGLYFSKEKPKRILRDIAVTPLSALPMLQSLPILNANIPAGNPNFTVKETMYVPEDVEFISVRPHMHLIGKEMRVKATLPDGTVKNLVYIKNWDFNWQENYYYAEPVKLPKDTKLDFVAVFDNSSDNPANPNSPPKPVAWGEGTTDEMAFCFFEVLPAHDARSDKDLQLSAVTKFLGNWVRYQVQGPHSPLSSFLKGAK